jgi:hypothetical protein
MQLRHIAPPILLALLAPMVAEYLLGDIASTNLAALPPMVLMYGSGALLVREVVRRTGGRWWSFALLAIAYGLLEEGVVTQSLFNPTYAGLRLLDYGFSPTLGTGLPWLVYVVGLHVLWSMATPIGLAESLFRDRRRDPWLSRRGIALFGLMLLAGFALVARFSRSQAEHFASTAQISATLTAALLLVAAALLLPVPLRGQNGNRRPPPAVSTFLVCLACGAVHKAAYAAGQSLGWPWPATTTCTLLADTALLAWIAFATNGRAWRTLDTWAAAMAGLLVYAGLGYQTLHTQHLDADLVGHSVLVALLLGLGAAAGVRAAGAADAKQDRAPNETRETRLA